MHLVRFDGALFDSAKAKPSSFLAEVVKPERPKPVSRDVPAREHFDERLRSYLFKLQQKNRAQKIEREKEHLRNAEMLQKEKGFKLYGGSGKGKRRTPSKERQDFEQLPPLANKFLREHSSYIQHIVAGGDVAVLGQLVDHNDGAGLESDGAAGVPLWGLVGRDVQGEAAARRREQQGDGALQHSKGFALGDIVEVRDEDMDEWRRGIVTNAENLKVRLENWDQSFQWDQVRWPGQQRGGTGGDSPAAGKQPVVHRRGSPIQCASTLGTPPRPPRGAAAVAARAGGAGGAGGVRREASSGARLTSTSSSSSEVRPHRPGSGDRTSVDRAAEAVLSGGFLTPVKSGSAGKSGGRWDPRTVELRGEHGTVYGLHPPAGSPKAPAGAAATAGAGGYWEERTVQLRGEGGEVFALRPSGYHATSDVPFQEEGTVQLRGENGELFVLRPSGYRVASDLRSQEERTVQLRGENGEAFVLERSGHRVAFDVPLQEERTVLPGENGEVFALRLSENRATPDVPSREAGLGVSSASTLSMSALVDGVSSATLLSTDSWMRTAAAASSIGSGGRRAECEVPGPAKAAASPRLASAGRDASGSGDDATPRDSAAADGVASDDPLQRSGTPPLAMAAASPAITGARDLLSVEPTMLPEVAAAAAAAGSRVAVTLAPETTPEPGDPLEALHSTGSIGEEDEEDTASQREIDAIAATIWRAHQNRAQSVDGLTCDILLDALGDVADDGSSIDELPGPSTGTVGAARSRSLSPGSRSEARSSAVSEMDDLAQRIRRLPGAWRNAVIRMLQDAEAFVPDQQSSMAAQ